MLREKELIVKTADKKNIYCTLGQPDKPSKSIVLLVHGCASTELWPTMLLASWYFRKHGYAYCRINLYHWKEGARSLMKSDLLTHSKDTDVVAGKLKRLGYKNIYAVGHSFGGLTLLRVDHTLLRAMSLWDISSFKKYPPDKRIKRQAKTGAHYFVGAYELLLSKRFMNGMLRFPDEHLLAAKISIPTQVCYADGEEGLLIDSSQQYFDALNCKKELFGVAGASHSFTEEGLGPKLFAKTKKWFDQN